MGALKVVVWLVFVFLVETLHTCAMLVAVACDWVLERVQAIPPREGKS